MKHVFISYKRQNSDFIYQLEQRLKQVDIDVWTDAEIQAGENWRDKIDDALYDAFAVIVVMTPEARASEYVTYEWSFAMGLGKVVIPIKVKETDLHSKLESLQYLDFTDHKKRDWDKLITVVKNLDIFGYGGQNTSQSIKLASASLSHLDAISRSEGIEALENMCPNPQAIKGLGEAILHDRLDVRVMASKALKQIIYEHPSQIFYEIIPHLKESMSDFSSDVRENILASLGQIGGDNILKYLWDLTKGTLFYQNDGRLTINYDYFNPINNILLNDKFTEDSFDLINNIFTDLHEYLLDNQRYKYSYGILLALLSLPPYSVKAQNIQIIVKILETTQIRTSPDIKAKDIDLSITQVWMALLMQSQDDREISTIVCKFSLQLFNQAYSVLLWLGKKERSISHLTEPLYHIMESEFLDAYIHDYGPIYDEEFYETTKPINIKKRQSLNSAKRLSSLISTKSSIHYLKTRINRFPSNHTMRSYLIDILQKMNNEYANEVIRQINRTVE